MNNRTHSAAPEPAPAVAAPAPTRFAAAGAGILAGAMVLGVGHLVAAFFAPDASPVYVMGATVVDTTPRPVEEWAIREFGSADKAVLFLVMAVAMIVVAACAGLLDRRHRYGSVLLAVAGAAVMWAATRRPDATLGWALPTLLGLLAGIATLRLLLDRAPTAPGPTEPSRRRFLALAVTAGALAAGSAALGQWIGTRLRDIAADRAGFAVPSPATPAPAVPEGADLPIDGLTDFVTSNHAFYRVDTALRLPALTSDDWRLRIHGLVARPVEYTFEQLRRRPAVARMITLTCVSNEVGGDLAGNALWTGYPLAELLAEAGPEPGADMVLSRSSDGFTASTPLAALTDGRDALLAVGMNGAPLPVSHGYPARLVVPGLYGYVSATKWVVELEVTRFDAAQAYWTRRGWAERAPVKTASRIDVPRDRATLPAGPIVVAGVAWAQHSGIDLVEVQVDDQPWRPATLAAEYSIDTWRQWWWQWPAEPGTHTLRVRATDRTGYRQTDRRTPPFPDGATGWHSRTITVR
ncbi:molybdopterin-dependent oxidoreductase [Nocardia cyriacigeorgica]|uniref:molybdopterin-dependent oxidoreductase n=1 Tax=Nocardia cyriacigeorgica TaxID=135487 RepID=UPI0018932CCE|nr:molybdopterin-dependent oxidoreductase [Nocardia cyriacigeorgica]MBF6081275.1 molybdopterin-dependent oxidoreductase [Nocardia cyriacigeorgica]